MRLLLALFFCFAFLVSAQATETADKKEVMSPEFMKAIAEAARYNELPKAKLPDGRVIGPETAEEAARPALIPAPAIEHAVQAGALIGYASFCKLDWKNRAMIPLMQQEKARGIWDEKDLKYIEIIMDLTRQSFEKNLPGTCTEKMRSMIASRLAK